MIDFFKERRAFCFCKLKMKILKKALRISLFILLFVILGIIIAGIATYIYINKNIDYAADEELFRAAKSTSVTHFYANSSLGGVYVPVEIDATAFGAQKKVWCPINEVSDYLKNGFIAAEDREFYSHKGVNVRRTLAALFNYVFKTKDSFGASTVTQQVVKNISGDNERSAKRKLYEIFRAINIEKNHTKSEILELYMNVVPMSDNIAGVAYAADRYFSKEPSELTLAEAATIVGITNSPARYDPRDEPEACIKRRNTVLLAMLDMNFISKDEYELATAEPLLLSDDEFDDAGTSWFIETVISDLTGDLSLKYGLTEAAARLKIMRGGYNIYTTENPYIQEALERVFENTDNLPPELSEGLNYSMCVCDSKTGALLGIVGAAGRKSGGGLLNLATVPHIPGSTLKPLALYAPLLNEKRINWATVFDDVPVEFKSTNDGFTAFPRNSPNAYDGLITVKDALRLSKNTVAVRLYRMLGARKIFNSLRSDFGFSTLVESAKNFSGTGTVTDLAVSPLALGQLSYGVPLRSLTEAYTVFPGDGELKSGHSYLFVTDKDGKKIAESPIVKKRVFSVPTARIMNQLLMNVTADGTASSLTLKDRVDTAGKTGTTSESRDKLFVGYTPYFTAGIWCGYPASNKSVGRLSRSHLDIWDEVMNEIHDLVDCEEHFSTMGLVTRDYCKDSGCIPDAVCSLDPRGDRIEQGWFTPDNAPSEFCQTHVLCKYDPLTDSVLYGDEEFEGLISIALLNIAKRDFPIDIKVSDEEYIFNPTSNSNNHESDILLPNGYGFEADEEKRRPRLWF